MTRLRSGINASTGTIPVDAPLANPTYPIFYDIDAETIKVTDHADTTEWSVERGAGDAAPSAHGDDVVLVPNATPFGGGGSITITDGTTTVDSATSLHLPAGTLSDLGGGEGGVGLIVQRIGPMRLHYNDVGIGTPPGIFVVSIPANSIVMDVVPIIRTNWGAEAGFTAIAGFPRLTVPGGNNIDFCTFDFWNAYSVDAQYFPSALKRTVTYSPQDSLDFTQVLVTSAADLSFYISTDPGKALTAGEVDIYAIIATPAA